MDTLWTFDDTMSYLQLWVCKEFVGKKKVDGLLPELGHAHVEDPVAAIGGGATCLVSTFAHLSASNVAHLSASTSLT